MMLDKKIRHESAQLTPCRRAAVRLDLVKSEGRKSPPVRLATNQSQGKKMMISLHSRVCCIYGLGAAR